MNSDKFISVLTNCIKATFKEVTLVNKATSEFSAGGRYERAAIRTHIKRKKDAAHEQGHYMLEEAYDVIHTWIKDRQKRYNKREGGLGR